VAAAALLAPAGEAVASPWVRLSDEATLSRWAYPSYPSKVRVAPDARARSFTRLRYRTEDGQPELYLALSKRVNDDGTSWVRVRLPMRPVGSKGWVRRSALERFHVVTQVLLVDRRALRATLYRAGRRIWGAPVGVGQAGLATPAGRFYAREKLRSLDPFYGPVAIGTSAYSHFTDWPGGGVVGIHGTSQPSLIPGRPSHGCVRVRNEDIVRLVRLMPLGTPIRIK
jgi:L,D-transpeptidase-like protein